VRAFYGYKDYLNFNNRNIAPACLPYRLAGQTERKATIVASGWGTTTAGGQNAPSLRKDVCHGDSGGSIDEKIDGKWYAVGVVSYGHGCAHKDEAGVYTRVSEYTSWIEQNTGINNFCKA
ncbi:unnamed protein product, partial [Allacma fusca]